MTVLSDLVGALAGVPLLEGAACRGEAWMADLDIRSSREEIDAAIEVCLGCPALVACSSWVDELPADQRPVGVVAGRWLDHRAYQSARLQRPAADRSRLAS